MSKEDKKIIRLSTGLFVVVIMLLVSITLNYVNGRYINTLGSELSYEMERVDELEAKITDKDIEISKTKDELTDALSEALVLRDQIKMESAREEGIKYQEQYKESQEGNN